ncbi:HNH endonuclease signature motif containing protein [Nocardia sp. XZ_19_231]|uniref:HNH endonuclease signature motif containing protein n=1 Tax=Nocardia sp. XZ_19_231 TaxID=2769252 RepID=UPI00188DF6A1|nr:HNH endonuclease signature motif containing protein [Nocardia sp. XZ_19_231]
MLNTTAEQRVQRAIQVDETGCWVWQRGKGSDGYGRINYDKVRHMAHRLAYETYVGAIPDGLVLDHLCRNRACVNPAHLEPVTIGENLKRGTAPNYVTHREGVCRRGHPITGDNVERTSDGFTKCRECHKMGNRRRYAARRQREGHSYAPRPGVQARPYAPRRAELSTGC